jgi:hypothetical protein
VLFAYPITFSQRTNLGNKEPFKAFPDAIIELGEEVMAG